MTASANRLLLRILLPLLLVVAAGILLGVKTRRLLVFESRLADTKEELARFGSRTADRDDINRLVVELEEAIEQERSRFFRVGEVDSASFGLALKQTLLSHGLTVDSYKITDDEGRASLELAVSGESAAFVEFLYHVAESDRYLAVSYLSINALEGRGKIRAILRISYAILMGEVQDGTQQATEGTPQVTGETESVVPFGKGVEISEATRSEISTISDLFMWFPGGRRAFASSKSADTGSLGSSDRAGTDQVEERPEVRAQWLQYVGSVVQHEREYYLFKDTRSNRIYRLSRESASPEGWRYLKIEGDIHYLEKGGTIYLVDR